MAPKFSPIIAMLLLAGMEVAAPSSARSEEAKAATLAPVRIAEAKISPIRMRCFLGVAASTLPVYGRPHGWQCMPEVRSEIAH